MPHTPIAVRLLVGSCIRIRLRRPLRVVESIEPEEVELNTRAVQGVKSRPLMATPGQ